MWQKQQQVGSHMACTPFVNLVEWKTWKRSTGLCWTKITIIYNLRNVYQTKDIHPWSESLKSVQVWVIEKSCNCALAHNSCKTTAENVDRHVTDVVTVKIISYKNSIIVPLSLLWLPWHQLLASFSARDRKYFSVGFIFRISEATLMVLRGWQRYEPTSIRLKIYSTPSWIFARTELLALAGVKSHVLVGRKRDRGTRSFSVDVRDFFSLSVRAHRCRTVSSSVHRKMVSYRFLALICRQCCPFFWGLFANARSEIMENGLLSGSERRKQSMAALRWISLMNFCKLTVCHIFCSQACKTSSEKQSVLLLTFLLSVSKIWCHQD